MKSPSFALLLLAVGSTNAWVLPKITPKFLQGFATAAGIAGAITLAPLAADAATGSVFNHQYNDPKHPNCKRIVVVKETEAAISGTDGSPGCPEDGSGTVWRLTGEVDGNTILVDFSPKGGPANLKGVWDAKDTPGIRWPDGNKWLVKN